MTNFCTVTGHRCGTDTWGNNNPCPCVNCQNWLANFPRSSQNQTVSSGVEGAHEGTTVDKTGSREPEKLNNAQPEKPYESSWQRLRADGWMVAVHNDYRLNGELFTFWLLTRGDRFIKGEGRSDEEAVALAESSLSQYTQPTENNGTSMNGFNNLARESSLSSPPTGVINVSRQTLTTREWLEAQGITRWEDGAPNCGGYELDYETLVDLLEKFLAEHTPQQQA